MRRNIRSSCTTGADIAAWRNVSQGVAPTRHVKANSFESNHEWREVLISRKARAKGNPHHLAAVSVILGAMLI